MSEKTIGRSLVIGSMSKHFRVCEPMLLLLDDRALLLASVLHRAKGVHAHRRGGARTQRGNPFSVNTCLGASRASRIHVRPPVRGRPATADRCTIGGTTNCPPGARRRLETPAHGGLVPRESRLIAEPARVGRFTSGERVSPTTEQLLALLGPTHSQGGRSRAGWSGSCRKARISVRSRSISAMADAPCCASVA